MSDEYRDVCEPTRNVPQLRTCPRQEATVEYGIPQQQANNVVGKNVLALKSRQARAPRYDNRCRNSSMRQQA